MHDPDRLIHINRRIRAIHERQRILRAQHGTRPSYHVETELFHLSWELWALETERQEHITTLQCATSVSKLGV